jgi:hypothetical protein
VVQGSVVGLRTSTFALSLAVGLAIASAAAASPAACRPGSPQQRQEEVIGYSVPFGQWAIRRTVALCSGQAIDLIGLRDPPEMVAFIEIYNRAAELKNRFYGSADAQARYLAHLQRGGVPQTWAVVNPAGETQPFEQAQRHLERGAFRPVQASALDTLKHRCTLEPLELVYDPRTAARAVLLIGRRGGNEKSPFPVLVRRTASVFTGEPVALKFYWEPLEAKYVGKRAPSVIAIFEHWVNVLGVRYPNFGFDLVGDLVTSRDPTAVTNRVYECVYE